MTTHTELAAQALDRIKKALALAEKSPKINRAVVLGNALDAHLETVIAALESTERAAGGGEPGADEPENTQRPAMNIWSLNYEPLYAFAEKNKIQYNELCAAARQAAAPLFATTPPPQAERVPLSYEQEDAARWRYLIKADCPTVCVMDDKTGEWLPIHPKNIQAVVDAERGIGTPKEST